MPDIEHRTVSASQAAALVGANPYETRWILAQRFLGNTLPRAGDNRMEWGLLMQPLLIKAAADDLHFEVIPNTANAYLRRGPFGCTRDAVIVAPDLGPGALETKCVFDFRQLMESWNGGKSPPRHVEIQLQVQMYVGDGLEPYRWGVIAMWCAGEMYYFKRDPIPELWAELERLANEFLEDIKAGRAGDPIGSELELPLLHRLFAPTPGKVLDLREHAKARHYVEQVRMWKWHSDERIGHTKGEESIKAELRAVIGDAEETLLPNGIKIKAKKVSRAGYTVPPNSFTTMTPTIPLNAAIDGDDPANMWGA